jgi:NADP-dependent 3-hydroxy acid dehydrogenase YdfG
MSQVVLITGCSTGIGRDLAQRLTQAGYTVVATAGKIETLDSLQAALKLQLDVTRGESICQAVDCVIERFGHIDVLVEPGSIKTQFHTTVEANAPEIFSNPDSPYRTLYEQYQKVTSNMRQQEAGPDTVSTVVEQAIKVSKPKARYVAGFPFSGKLILFPDNPVWDLVVRNMFQIHDI